jgi:nitrite reductase/ring-hydroxylating ferredoxin subunit
MAELANVTEIRRADPKKGKMKRIWRPVPAEGENGVFSQSWFAVAWSSEVPVGKVVGRDFLDGRIVLFRGENGRLVAMSAYCPHVGADLAVGEVIGNNLRCAFHHWQYNQDGQCVKTGIGDKPPKGACTFVFPTLERFGIVFVFNGEEPLFDVPKYPIPDDQLVSSSPYPLHTLHCEPWVFCANTPDMQHFKAVHKIKFDGDDPHDMYQWGDYGFQYQAVGLEQGDVPYDYTLGIRGTTIFFRYGIYGGFWRGSIVAFGLPRPGRLLAYAVNSVQKGPEAEKNLEISNSVSRRTISEDEDIMDTIHYRPGHLTQGDRSLSRFLNYLRKYPRAHPSADFIR